MIVANASDPVFLDALARAAHPEEDVVSGAWLAHEALEVGYPRLLVTLEGKAFDLPRYRRAKLRELSITPAMIVAWEESRRARSPVPGRVDHLAGRLAMMVERHTSDTSWVDRMLADLSRTSGAQLPLPLRAFGRRVLEFPAFYPDLSPLADRCGVSRGALKARFRRRGLASPYAYLRWFRVIATANVLSDPEVTVAQAASRLGFTSNGNLCRTMKTLTGLNPSEVRDAGGRNRLLVGFSTELLTPEALRAWAGIHGLFRRRAA